MSTYVFAYYGAPNFESQEEGSQYKTQWRAWVESLGEAVVNPTIPMKSPKTVSANGVSDNSNGEAQRLTGLFMVEADSMDAALEMAKRCPHLQHGTIDVAETIEM